MLRIELSDERGNVGGRLSEVPCVVTLVLVAVYEGVNVFKVVGVALEVRPESNSVVLLRGGERKECGGVPDVYDCD
jgi:hypothetical protein